MSAQEIVAAAAAGTVVAAAAGAVVWSRRKGLGGRSARLMRLGQLGAQLGASSVGAWVRQRFAGPAKRARLDEATRKRNAETITQAMGQMKGALMKLGQMLSCVSDDIPAEYRAALASLQAEAPPMDFAVVRDVVERELDGALERKFARFDEKPLAAASIGQVHRARLPTGEEVVVKVQYPGVAEAIAADLANVGTLYGMLGMLYPSMDPKPIVAELAARLGEELDYRKEAENQAHFGFLYRDHPFIRVPGVYTAYSTTHILTSEYVAGRRFTEAYGADQAEKNRIGEILYRFVFGSILRYGVFNGDPHPGNYLLDSDGKVIFLDYGCVKYFPPDMLKAWRALVGSHLTGNHVSFRRHLVELGFITDDAPLDADGLYSYFDYFYEPAQKDEPFQFTRAYNAQSFRRMFSPDGQFAGFQKHLNMPPDFVFVNRIQWGVYSILAELTAEANWRRIDAEYRLGKNASTPLGETEAAYRKKRRAEKDAPVEVDLPTFTDVANVADIK